MQNKYFVISQQTSIFFIKGTNWNLVAYYILSVEFKFFILEEVFFWLSFCFYSHNFSSREFWTSESDSTEKLYKRLDSESLDPSNSYFSLFRRSLSMPKFQSQRIFNFRIGFRSKNYIRIDTSEVYVSKIHIFHSWENHFEIFWAAGFWSPKFQP